MAESPSEKTTAAEAAQVAPGQAGNLKVIPAPHIFEGQREVVIEHEGERYRLRITRRNKLILQK